MSTIEDILRKVVREELRADLARIRRDAKKRRRSPPCGRGNAPPICIGSAAFGPQGCTCP